MPEELNYFSFICSSMLILSVPKTTSPFRIPGYFALQSDGNHSRSGSLSHNELHTGDFGQTGPILL